MFVNANTLPEGGVIETNEAARTVQTNPLDR
jgi:hypothetical protein